MNGRSSYSSGSGGGTKQRAGESTWPSSAACSVSAGSLGTRGSIGTALRITIWLRSRSARVDPPHAISAELEDIIERGAVPRPSSHARTSSFASTRARRQQLARGARRTVAHASRARMFCRLLFDALSPGPRQLACERGAPTSRSTARSALRARGCSATYRAVRRSAAPRRA